MLAARGGCTTTSQLDYERSLSRPPVPKWLTGKRYQMAMHVPPDFIPQEKKRRKTGAITTLND
jgi:hypothetical protein